MTMENNHNDIDDLIFGALNNYSEEPSEQVKNNIKKALFFNRFKKWLQYGAILFVVFAGIIFYHNSGQKINRHDESIQSVLTSTEKPSISTNTAQESHNEPELSDNTTSLFEKVNNLKKTETGQSKPAAGGINLGSRNPPLIKEYDYGYPYKEIPEGDGGVIPGPENDIRNLKEGYLLVRLRTSSHQIEALKKAGMNAQSEQLIRRQKADNLEIAKAFNQAYTFGKVFFFYSNFSDSIRSRKFEGCIMNEKLETIKSGINLSAEIYIAEFGITDNMGVGALIILNSAFNPMHSSFPYYSRTLSNLPLLKRSKQKVVERWNEDLFEFYNKHWE